MEDLITKEWNPKVASEFLNYVAARIDTLTGEDILDLLDNFRNDAY